MWEFAPYAGLSILLGGFLGIVADRIFYGHIIDVIVHGSENLNSRNDACVGLGRYESLNCIKVRCGKSETHTFMNRALSREGPMEPERRWRLLQSAEGAVVGRYSKSSRFEQYSS